MSKDPTRHQISSKLGYHARTPAFLQKMKRRVEGKADEDEDEEYEWDGTGRPPIPRRPSIPERPEGDPGSAGEDDEDEAPQVVVLKEGKHLSAREVQNEKRQAQGLAPLPEVEEDPSESADAPSTTATKPPPKSQSESLSFSSSASTSKAANKKRKVITSEDTQDGPETKKPHKSKRPKKVEKKLLSFDV